MHLEIEFDCNEHLIIYFSEKRHIDEIPIELSFTTQMNEKSNIDVDKYITEEQLFDRTKDRDFDNII
jgi:hypothetical protein